MDMLSNSANAHYIQNCLAENLHNRKALYVLTDKSSDIKARVDKFMNNQFIDYATLTFKKPDNASDLFYGAALTKYDLLELCKSNDDINEEICKEFLFQEINRSLMLILQYISKNPSWFDTNYPYHNQEISNAFKALSYINNIETFSIYNKDLGLFLESLKH